MKKLILLFFALCTLSASAATYTHQARLRPDNYNSALIGNTTAQISVVYGYGNDLSSARTQLMSAAGSASCQQLWQAYRNTYSWSFGYPGFSGIAVDPSWPSTQFTCSYSNGQSLPLQFSVSSGTYTVCPPNSTQSGNTCTCNSGYVDEGGQCVAYVDPCANTQGLTTGYTRLEVQFSNVNPSPSALGSFVGQTVKTAVPINGNSCAATGQVESCALAGTTLYCILTGSTYTGATYNGEQSLFGLPQIDPNATPENELPKVCPEGQYAGEVNGTQVCVKANGSANTTQSTTTNPDGTSTTTTTTTACVGDKCTSTTTTETKDAQGNTTGTGTSKVEGDKDAFCIANPQAPECKNTKSNFGGTCDAAFTCESEDAVMCAIALDQYKTNCEVLKRDENLGQNLADLIDAPLTDLDLDTTSIQAPQASGSSCSITPFSIPVGIGAFTVDLTHMCAYLSIIKAIVTAFGFVMWTLIVFVRQ